MCGTHDGLLLSFDETGYRLDEQGDSSNVYIFYFSFFLTDIKSVRASAQAERWRAGIFPAFSFHRARAAPLVFSSLAGSSQRRE